MVLAVVNENGEILDRQSIPTETPDITMPKITAYFKEQQVDSVGVACFGPVDVKKNSPTYGHILVTPKLAWRGYDIIGYMDSELHVPLYLDTDVNGSAIGESKWGAARDVDSCVYVTIGTGIGIGVIIDGKPLHGALHPEGGHILMIPKEGDTYKGKCPTHGTCFEGMAAGPAIEERWGKPGRELAEMDEVWELESYYIAQALMSYILILSPKKIILGGGVMKQTQLFPLIRKKVVEMLNGYLNIPEIEDIDNYIVAPGLIDDQGILGCAAMVLDNE